MSELWPNGPEYEGGGAFPITTDSVLLADFVRLRPGLRVFEPCSGAGLISLLLLAREPRLDVCALELDGAACEAARRNFAANGFRADVVCGDLRDAANLPAANSCGLAVCNPPYFPAGSGRTAPDGRRALARSEGGCTLADAPPRGLCARADALRWCTVRSAWRSSLPRWRRKSLSPSACALCSTGHRARRGSCCARPCVWAGRD